MKFVFLFILCDLLLTVVNPCFSFEKMVRVYSSLFRTFLTASRRLTTLVISVSTTYLLITASSTRPLTSTFLQIPLRWLPLLRGSSLTAASASSFPPAQRYPGSWKKTAKPNSSETTTSSYPARMKSSRKAKQDTSFRSEKCYTGLGMLY